jgi:drug/metabolite transporter (DMT)-like permease
MPADPTRSAPSPFQRVLSVVGSPYLLLSFAILCWGGNFVVGRLANLDVPPVALSFWRHLLATVIILPFALPALKRDWPTVRKNLGTAAVWSALFVAGNTLVYFAVLNTTITNAALINAGVPVAAAFFSWLILRDLINRWQALGIALCFLGIAFVVTRSDLGLLLRLELNWGDLFMLLAVLCWALYMVLLKRAHLGVSPLTVLFVLAAGGTLWLVPCYGIEIATGATMAWTGLTAASILYVALFSTIVAWACWNSGTLRIGPNRASAFMSLHPVFGAALGAIFFGEVLRPYHLYGTALVLVGVFLVSRLYRSKAPA